MLLFVPDTVATKKMTLQLDFPLRVCFTDTEPLDRSILYLSHYGSTLFKNGHSEHLNFTDMYLYLLYAGNIWNSGYRYLQSKKLTYDTGTGTRKLNDWLIRWSTSVKIKLQTLLFHFPKSLQKKLNSNWFCFRTGSIFRLGHLNKIGWKTDLLLYSVNVVENCFYSWSITFAFHDHIDQKLFFPVDWIDPDFFFYCCQKHHVP